MIVKESMPIGTKPPAEVTIDLALVRALIQAQHQDLSHLALRDSARGGTTGSLGWATNWWSACLGARSRPR